MILIIIAGWIAVTFAALVAALVITGAVTGIILRRRSGGLEALIDATREEHGDWDIRELTP